MCTREGQCGTVKALKLLFGKADGRDSDGLRRKSVGSLTRRESVLEHLLKYSYMGEGSKSERKGREERRMREILLGTGKVKNYKS